MFEIKSASAQKVVVVFGLVQKISIIKIGLVYVIMIVITSWRHHTHQSFSWLKLQRFSKDFCKVLLFCIDATNVAEPEEQRGFCLCLCLCRLLQLKDHFSLCERGDWLPPHGAVMPALLYSGPAGSSIGQYRVGCLFVFQLGFSASRARVTLPLSQTIGRTLFH